jgi:predicted RNA binding protein YcfA (HicA-like mRNA interferase family)
MKREDLLRKMVEAGAVFVRYAGKHDWYENPETGVQQAVPRHRDINEYLA